MDVEKNSNLRRLCKMARAWKNKHGVSIGGLLIDTLAYNFLRSTKDYDGKSYLYYDWLSRDFFKYLSELPEQDYYAAPGSGQRVKVKKKFQKKAKKAYDLCLKAIDAGEENSNDKWKKIYGRPFPAKAKQISEVIAEAAQTWRNTEEFIEDKYPVDIRYYLKIDCEVSQDGFRENFLTVMLKRRIPLLTRKKLMFRVSDITVPEPYSIEWKVLNRGEEARKRDEIRGQIVSDHGYMRKEEKTSFKGAHVVECYAIKNGVVVAKDRIDVPIQGD